MIKNGWIWFWPPRIAVCEGKWDTRSQQSTEAPRCREVGKFPEHTNVPRSSAVQTKFHDNSMKYSEANVIMEGKEAHR